MTPTPSQQAIIDAPARGHAFVIAGPGAGLGDDLGSWTPEVWK